MLYRYTEEEENGKFFFDLNKVESFSIFEFGNEKTLENILAEIFSYDGAYMPIFQERRLQPEPDLVALDENGNLILFELKRGYIDKKAALDDRLFRYHSVWKNFSYDDLNKNYRKYKKDNSADLLDDHKKFFGVSLSKSDFNRAQKLIAVANVVSDDLIDYIESLNKRGDYTVDFIPYRFYKVGKEVFIEFFSKPFDDDFVARRRHNLICKIASALNDKMDYSFCSSHKFSRKYFDGSNLDLRKWNGHERFILSFSCELLFSGATDLHVQGFSLGVGGKNFYISFRVRNNQDSVVSCSEAAKNISALNDVKFKRMSDSKGEEYFRYDLPISSKYPTVDFVAMDDAARSLFDGKNFDAAINHIISETEQFFTQLTATVPQITSSFTQSTTKTNTLSAVNFKTVDDLLDRLAKSTNGQEKLAIKNEILAALSKLKEATQQNRDAVAMRQVGIYYGRLHEHDEASKCYSRAEEFKSSTIITPPAKTGGEPIPGTNLTWRLDNGTLTISGKGDMKDWDNEKKPAPWYDQRAAVEKIVIKDGVTSIGDNAFEDCHSLTSIVIPDSVMSIGAWTFDNCGSLKNVVIPNSVKFICECAFVWCESLTSIALPDNVAMDNAVFVGCTSLKKIDQPSKVIFCDDLFVYEKKSDGLKINSFIGTLGVSAAVIPDSVTAISDFAFSYCDSLKEIFIPNSVTSIGDCAFQGCELLTNATLSPSVKKIGYSIFSDCKKLQSIRYKHGLDGAEKLREGNNARLIPY